MLLAVTVLPDEQLMIYRINRARHDPVAYQNENGLLVDLSYVTPRPPLAVNNKLVASAQFHAREMADYNYFGHQSAVTGDWPNGMARDAGYVLPTGWEDDANYIESIAAGFLNTPAALEGLIVDAGIEPPGHRIHLLGIDAFNADNREVGVGYATNSSSDYERYWAIHATRSDPAGQFLTGVAFNDLNGNRRYDLNEGLGNVTITAGALSTTTNAAGRWSLPIANGQYLVTASGGAFVGTSSVPVTANSASIEVDFVSGLSVGYRNFQHAANTAPTLNAAASPTLKPVVKNTASPAGDVVAGIVGDTITDPDPAALEGIAVFGLTGSATGTWQYSINNGSSWSNVGAVSASSALLLRDIDLIRYVPAVNFTGPVSIEYRAWDRTFGAPGDKVSLGSVGGTSAFSAASDSATLTVVASNTAPTLSTVNPLSMAPILEDATNPAPATVRSIIGSAVSDPDPGTRPGAAVLGVSPASRGVWQYSLDGGATWSNMPPVSLTAAFLLRDSDLLRFIPAANYSGSAGFSFRAWDQSAGAAGSFADVSLPGMIGGSTAFSNAFHSASITINPVNDAPVLDVNGPFVMTPVRPDATIPGGDTIASIVGDTITDPDAGALTGIAVIGTAGTGTWYFFTDGGWWYVIGDIMPHFAIPLKATDRIAFVPDNPSGATASFTFRAWDQTTGLPPGQWYVDLSAPSAYGGSTAYSADAATATVAIANPASIKGAVYRDLNGDGAKQAGEPAVAGWTVYVDADNDGQKDSNERSAVTDAGGNYTITNLAPGSHVVRVITQDGAMVSHPLLGYHHTTLSDGQISQNNDFAITDARPAISILDASLIEGNSGTVNLAFTVTLSKASAQTVTVSFATAPGSATSPADYTHTAGTLTFSPNQTSRTINVPIVGDSVFENDETFTVTLSNPTNATLDRAVATGTIINNEQPHLLGTAGGDTFHIRMAPGGGSAQFWVNSPTSNPPTYTAASGYKSITIDGVSGKDSLTVDMGNGNPVPMSGLIINSGEVTLNTTPAGAATYDLVVQSTQVWLAGGQAFTSITAYGTALVSLQQSGPLYLRTRGLTIGSAARLDLGQGALIVTPPTNVTPGQALSQISTSIQTARAGGAWTGGGLTSSAAQADAKRFTTVAAAINDKGGAPLFTTFPKIGGVPVAITDVLVRFTYNGDANLDGTVNADDYFLIDQGFVSQKGNYYNGDFNYDRTVNADDYFLIDSAFVGQGSPLGSGPAAESVLASLFGAVPIY